MKLPQYRCHKIVGAVKIKEVMLAPAGDHAIVPEDTSVEPFPITEEWRVKHKPEAGGVFQIVRAEIAGAGLSAPFASSERVFAACPRLPQRVRCPHSGRTIRNVAERAGGLATKIDSLRIIASSTRYTVPWRAQ